MKNLMIPVVTEDFIDLAIIYPDYPGIIICYNNKKPVGHIVYEDEWTYCDTIFVSDSTSSPVSFNSLIQLIFHLIKNKECDSFKVIEYGKENNNE